ncbi:MAG: hypothetical protein N2050_04815 [Flavobacteriales bacterium]|nr:hypothetical protein [Flavobacteriales bacterium]
MAAIETIKTLAHVPLHNMIEQMGIAIARAQAALDQNSVQTLIALSQEKLTINNEEVSLLQLGFTPSFYAFTEASFEMKMEFSMAESEAFSIGGSLDLGVGTGGNDEKKSSTLAFGLSFSASYGRKFDQSASASSSIAAKLVSVPPPENFVSFLNSLQNKSK